MRIVDLVFAFPTIMLAMAGHRGAGPEPAATRCWRSCSSRGRSYARVMRGLVLSAATSGLRRGGRLLGAPRPRALPRRTAQRRRPGRWCSRRSSIGNAILLLAGLSFLGLGAQPPDAEWGAMVAAGAQHFQQWWIGTFPGLAIFTVVLAFNFLGDSLRDVLDPRSRPGDARSEGDEPRCSQVEGLRVRLPGRGGPSPIVDGVDFGVDEGEMSASPARAAAARR